MAKHIYRKGLMHHRYKFGIGTNIKVWFCRTFGHELNVDKNHSWCERCNLCHEEIYYKQNNGK